jgi:SNF2 family DNA or RNA helicase
MSSRLVLRHARPEPGAPPLPAWLVDACPLAYEEAGRQQFSGMPGILWVRTKSAPNGRGFYRGPREAVEIVAALLESAGVVRVHSELSAPSPEGVAHAQSWSAGQWPAGFRQYQVEGSSWCAHMLRVEGGALLADEMGIGKTAQALAACEALSPAGAVLVVAPAIVKPQWHSQQKRWAPSLTVHPHSYEGFTKLMKAGVPYGYDALVVDELHYASNPKSQRSKALATWRAANPNTPVLGLTGTPMTAEPRDLWHPLQLLWPGRFGTQWQFEKRYCDGRFVEIPHTEKTVWDASGCSRAEELGARLARLMLRRTKDGVALELPPRTRVITEVEIPERARRSLAKAAAAIDGRVGVSSLLSNIEEYKIDAAVQLAEEARRNGERVLLLTTRKATAATLGAQLNAPHADGEDSVAKRQELLANAPVAVATLYSVSTGVDYLSGFSTLIMVGLDWLPSVILQGESRVHRIGSSKPVTIHYLIGRGTLDEVVRERVLDRLEVFASIAGAGSDGLASELAGGGEDELLAGIVASVRGAMAA